jgi:penicillin G amidase
VNLRVRVTRHGPILNDVMGSLKDKEPLALRWTASEPGSILESVVKLNRAQNWDEFRTALRDWDVPSQNFVYADVDGNIGYQMPSRVPIRAKGDGTVPVPGYSGEYEWTGYVPFDDLPHVFNPQKGYIATANNAPVDAQYAHFLGRDWDYGYRIRRINQMIEAKPKLSVDDVKQIQADNQSVFAGEVIPFLTDLPIPQEPLVAAALDTLKQWDQRSTRDSVGALIFETFWLRLAHRVFDAPLGSDLAKDVVGTGTHTKTAIRNLLPNADSRYWREAAPDTASPRQEVLLQALRDAVTVLQAKYGADIKQWQWGRAHQITFANQTLGKSGIALVESIFNRGPFAVDGAPAAVNNTGGGGETMQVTSGPSWRMIVDMSDFSKSQAIHTTGQSGHAYHPHNDDMIRKWIEVQYNPYLFSRAEVDRYAEGTLTLTP